MKECVVVSAYRSPSGKIPGKLNSVDEIGLLARIFRSVSAAGPAQEALAGCSFPLEKDNLCRKAVLAAGLPAQTNAATISKTCASSDEALRIGCERIWLGTSRSVLVGGIEKISNSPHVLQVMKQNVKRQIHGQILCRKEAFAHLQENDMAYLAERLAWQHGITRKQQDSFTIQSIQKALGAQRKGWFQREIVEIACGEEGENRLARDELLEWNRTQSDIRQATPMFLRDGTLTQYNAAPVCDCAVGVLLMERQTALAQGLIPLAIVRSVVSWSTDRLGECMQECVAKLLQTNGLHRRDVELYEINESFAAQALCVIHALELDLDRVNVNGGNLALGYPIGAAGLRMLVTLTHEMRRRCAHLGLSVMCAGGAMAQAVLLENAQ